MDTHGSDTAPKILENLVAAGLVSHELIGDPAQVPTEADALAALCERVAGPVYRLGPYHYAFRAAPEDLGGTLAELEPEAWAGALDAALAEALGPEAVWVSAAELAAGAEAELDATGLLFLRAADGATSAALVEAPELRAVIHAGIAAAGAAVAAKATATVVERATAEAARAVGGEAAALSDAIGALSVRIESLEMVLETRIETGLQAALDAAVAGPLRAILGEALAAVATPESLVERIAGTLAVLAERLQAQASELAAQSARQEALASGMAALEAAMSALATAETARPATFEAFESRLGLTLAEFLAQMTPQAVPHAAPPAVRVVEAVSEARAAALRQPAARLG